MKIPLTFSLVILILGMAWLALEYGLVVVKVPMIVLS